ncbi:MAG: trehalose-6-phosphate synthase [Candidatus Hadarchaeia archaeon]
MGLEGRKVILVSNAEPYAHKRKNGDIQLEKLAGGLTTALNPLMKETGGTWIAWGREDADFEVLNSENKVMVPDENGYELKRIKLTEQEVDNFYLGFSNEILWPICHSFPEKARLNNFKNSKRKWKFYRNVNKKYSKFTLEEIERDDLVWAHDYHLSLLPKKIKEKKPETNIAFFWHIPWPPWEMFGLLPWREEIMKGLLSNNFLGFHTPKNEHNFLKCAENLDMDVNWNKSKVKHKTGNTKVDSIPLGINYDWFRNIAEKKRIRKKAAKLKEKIPAEKIILGIDRLDYTKGIPRRLRAFEMFLEENPEFQGKVTLVQRIPPSRGSVKEYQSILDRINKIIGEINGKFEKAMWTPVKSFHRLLPSQEQLIPYYLAAEVALVTPLVDGMNLVCKEYIASTDDGVLILSEFAGAANELREAILVNPYDVRETAESIKKGLEMSNREKKRRMKRLQDRVKKNDLENWRKNFLKKWLD